MLKPDIQYYPNWLKEDEAEQLFSELLTLAWQTEVLQMYGRQITVPRKVIWYADDHLNYRYAGLDHIGLDFPACLNLLRLRLNNNGYGFNSCLANLYEQGNDYMGWHSDNEKCLGKQPVIASISLGVTRDFHFKHKISKQVYKMQLHQGDLLIMQGDTQDYWYHCLPKRKRVSDIRINLTFRKMISNG